MRFKPIYRVNDNWVLCTCNECNALNYVEPHGTTTTCVKCRKDTEHTPIPSEQRDSSGCFMLNLPEGPQQ